MKSNEIGKGLTYPESAAACKCFVARAPRSTVKCAELKGNEIGTGLTFSREHCDVQILRGEDPDRQSSTLS